MPELNFQITGVEAVMLGLTPLLHFKLQITTTPPGREIQAVLLTAQIQIQTPQRRYSAEEKKRLEDLFGKPERWGQTLRERYWTRTNATIGSFSGTAEIVLPVPCTFDLNIAAAKYFYALEEGDIPLQFLFSGSVFHAASDGRLQVERISWNKECSYRVPVATWKALMDHHYPDSGWLYLQRDIFDRLWAYKCRNGFPTWEKTIDGLLPPETADNDSTELARDGVPFKQEASA